MRCFLAIELSEIARDHLCQMQDTLRLIAPRLSYPKSDSLHLTLKFLGETSTAQMARLGQSMQHVRVESPINLRSESPDLLPDDGPLRIVAVRLGGDDAKLRGLHDAIEQRCRFLKFPKEDRDFRPHVTLARVKSPLPPGTRKQLEETMRQHLPGPDFAAGDFVLFESRLRPDGATYRAIERFG